LLHEGDAAFADDLVEAVDGLEVCVGERFIDELPEVLGRLQFGAVRRLEHEADAIGQAQVLRAVPTRLVELDHRALLVADADRLGEVGEHGLKHFLAYSV